MFQTKLKNLKKTQIILLLPKQNQNQCEKKSGMRITIVISKVSRNSPKAGKRNF